MNVTPPVAAPTWLPAERACWASREAACATDMGLLFPVLRPRRAIDFLPR